MTIEERIAELTAQNAALVAANAALEAANAPKTGLKVSEKGAVSLYGIGRFPVTLYPEQFIRVLDKHQEIRDFIKENWNKFSHKTPKGVEAKPEA